MHRRMQSRGRWLAASALVLAAGGLLGMLLAGCTSDGGAGDNPRSDREPVNVGLDVVASEDDAAAGPALPDAVVASGNRSQADQIAQQARDLGDMMDEISRITAQSGRPAAGEEAISAADQGAGQALQGDGVQAAAVSGSADAPPQALPAGQSDTGMGISLSDVLGGDSLEGSAAAEALADQIERVVATRLPASESPMRDALALIAADLLRPGGPSGEAAIDQQTLDALSASERQTLDTLRDSLREVAAASADGGGDMASALQAAAEKLQQAVGVRIGRVELCSRVDKFGSFVPFRGREFMAGAPSAALVYVEVEGYTHRPTKANEALNTPGDQWAVDLTQQIRLFHKADGRLAWSSQPERVVDTSRNRRRDFYLVTRIDLPPSLTVGSYELQVTVTDETSGTTDQRAVLIGVVADRNLVTAVP